MEVKTVGQTYQEFLREVRAKQFGREKEVISKITEGTTVVVKEPEIVPELEVEEPVVEKKKSGKKSTKKEVKDSE